MCSFTVFLVLWVTNIVCFETADTEIHSGVGQIETPVLEQTTQGHSHTPHEHDHEHHRESNPDSQTQTQTHHQQEHHQQHTHTHTHTLSDISIPNPNPEIATMKTESESESESDKKLIDSYLARNSGNFAIHVGANVKQIQDLDISAEVIGVADLGNGRTANIWINPNSFCASHNKAVTNNQIDQILVQQKEKYVRDSEQRPFADRILPIPIPITLPLPLPLPVSSDANAEIAIQGQPQYQLPKTEPQQPQTQIPLPLPPLHQSIINNGNGPNPIIPQPLQPILPQSQSQTQAQTQAFPELVPIETAEAVQKIHQQTISQLQDEYHQLYSQISYFTNKAHNPLFTCMAIQGFKDGSYFGNLVEEFSRSLPPNNVELAEERMFETAYNTQNEYFNQIAQGIDANTAKFFYIRRYLRFCQNMIYSSTLRQFAYQISKYAISSGCSTPPTSVLSGSVSACNKEQELITKMIFIKHIFTALDLCYTEHLDTIKVDLHIPTQEKLYSMWVLRCMQCTINKNEQTNYKHILETIVDLVQQSDISTHIKTPNCEQLFTTATTTAVQAQSVYA